MMLAKSRVSALILGSAIGLGLLVSLVWVASDRDEPAKAQAEPAAMPAPAGEGELVVQGVTVVDAGSVSRDAELKVEVEWSEGVFPGIRPCSFDAFDTSGKLVGNHSDIFAVLEPSTPGIPVHLDVDASMATVEGSCDEERLDTGTPYEYGFSGTTIEASPDELGAYLVSLSAAWQGSGQPGVVSCQLKLLGDDTELDTADFNLFILEGTGEFSRTMVAPASSDPTTMSTTLLCAPFAG